MDTILDVDATEIGGEGLTKITIEGNFVFYDFAEYLCALQIVNVESAIFLGS